MSASRLLLAASVLFSAGTADAQPWLSWAPGALVGVGIDVDGRSAPLYPAQDGSGRYYLEAREGREYAVRLDNRSGERLGVVLSVDGLNAISGARDRSLLRPSDPGRMYVLEPWESTLVRGWRSSVRDVHRFTFVDERSSYATRSGQPNGKMGWIEVAVYRERRPLARRQWNEITPAPSAAPYRDGERSPEARSSDAARPGEKDAPKSEAPSGRAESYPGTGWGAHAHDPVMVVSFDPCPEPAERLTLRYEYASALARLGIRPAYPPASPDRLSERERGRDGFARPPR